MNHVEAIFHDAKDTVDFASKYLDYLSQLLRRMDPKPIGKFIDLLNETRKRGHQILVFGNGGSAATASHFANDIMAGPRCWENPYRTIALTDNVALITAIGNDHGYDKIFVLQLQALMRKGDLVIGISASGNSPNVIQAMEYAKQHGGTTVGWTGFDGGALAKMVDLNLHVPTAKGEYGPVEDIHMVIDHLVGAYLLHHNRVAQKVAKIS